jgi:hypothetical protein
MEIYKLVDSIFEKLKESNFYSEIPIEVLKDTVFQHLNSSYKDMVDELSFYFNMKKMSGVPIEDEDYDEEFTKIGAKLSKIIEEISRTK